MRQATSMPIQEMPFRVLALCCTHNRYKCLQRSLRCFLMQNYPHEHTMLIYNTGEPLVLEDLPILEKYPLKKVYLVNVDKMRFNSVGEKYQSALSYAIRALGDFDIFNSWDDDDLMMQDHIYEGVRGYARARLAGKAAYKPLNSYYRDVNGLHKVSNVHEPSIFASISHVARFGFADVSVRYHQQWLGVLEKDGLLSVEPDGKPTWIYDWHPELKVFKMSGMGDDGPANFNAHAQHSNDTGGGARLVPSKWGEIQQIFNMANELK